MVLFIECLIGVILFGIAAPVMTARDPLGAIGDYPPAIRQRCIELGLIKKREKCFTKSDLIRKGLAMVLFAVVFAFIMIKVNKATTFKQGFIESYIIWLVICWFDALVVDCLWFCHSPKVRIPGTEDMKEYHDYLFHIKQSLIGTLLGLPVCLLVGLFVQVL
ncbi:MAG: hypothetical protein II704_03370 [Erysipelotrichaceae bacterium]|nr:hypothetical protein [Erysipelotrichaceae bacterium]